MLDSDSAPRSYGDVRDDYDDEFGRGSSPAERLLRKVWWPALALVVLGNLGFWGMVALVVDVAVDEFERPGRPDLERVAMVASFAGLAAVIYGIVVFGGRRMMRLRSRRLCLAAAWILVGHIVPLGIGSIVVLPFGIWALVVLYQQDVRRAFAEGAP